MNQYLYDETKSIKQADTAMTYMLSKISKLEIENDKLIKDISLESLMRKSQERTTEASVFVMCVLGCALVLSLLSHAVN